MIWFNFITSPLYHLGLDLPFSFIIPLEWSYILYFTYIFVVCPSYALRFLLVFPF